MFDFIFDKEDKAMREMNLVEERKFIMMFLTQMYL